MRVFLSWSGERSRSVAKALADWLPMMLQHVQPWFSGGDIEKGTRWSDKLTVQLAESRFAIICLTPENLDGAWINYEAGALSKSTDSPFVVPFLFGFTPGELRGPLAMFQAAQADREDTWKLVQTMNRALGNEGVNEERLLRLFEVLWPKLAEQFTTIARVPVRAHETPATVAPTMGFDALTSRIDQLEQTIRALVTTPKANESGAASEIRNVFLVHGRNEGVRDTVARYLEKLGVAPIILQEQANEGRTVIEKFETFSQVGYAVVLMTGDDVGGLAGATETLSRARQNVIFELGYFVAKLGRSRLCVLHEKGVEMPSDFSGVLYVVLDKEGMWRWHLARELKASGIPIDMNGALE